MNQPRRPQPVKQSATSGRSLSGKALVALSAVGPGLFLIGYNIGTGSITTMGMAGARYGMNLLWALVLSGIFTYVLMVGFGRLTLVTGRTALQSFKTGIPRVGKVLALYVLAALVLGELVALTGVMGIVAELLQEGIRLASPGDALVIPTGWIVLAVASAIFLMLWFGHYRLFEKVLTVFVILMVFCFVAVFFMVSPTYSAVVAGMVPSIPDTPDASRLVAAMAGTTCSAAVFIVRSTVVAEKGWTVDDLGREKRDALVSASVMVFLSAMVMAVAAGTLFVHGMTMESTLEMIGLLEPIGGDLAACAVDLVAYGCTSGSMACPADRLLGKLREASGAKAVSTADAILAALNALGVKRIAMATPYTDETNAHEAEFLERHGIEVVAASGLGLNASLEKIQQISRVAPKAVFDHALAVDRPEAEALLICCTDFNTLDAIEPLEEALGKPVVTSNAATLWASLRAAGVDDRIAGCGRLLNEF